MTGAGRRPVWPFAVAALTALAVVGVVVALLLVGRDGGAAQADARLGVQECIGQELSPDGGSACFERVLQAAARDGALTVAREEIERLAAAGGKQEEICHGALHELGAVEAVQPGFDVVAWLRAGPTAACTGGLMHGALLAWGEQLDGVTEEVTQVPAACGALPVTAGEACADGLGHALWLATGGDAGSAFAACTSTPGLHVRVYEGCMGGVTMQGALQEVLTGDGFGFEEAVAAVPSCNVSGPSKCPAAVASGFATLVGNAPWGPESGYAKAAPRADRAVQACSLFPDRRQVSTCAERLYVDWVENPGFLAQACPGLAGWAADPDTVPRCRPDAA